MSRTPLLAALAIVLLAAPAAAQAPPVPSDLALVPADALGFVHVRLADVWKHESLKEYRKVFERAGPRAIAALDDQFLPPPTTIERVTAVALPMDPERREPRVVAVLTFNAAFDPAKVRSRYLPDAKGQRSGGKVFYADENSHLAVHFPDDRTLVVGDDKTVPEFLARPAKATGAMADAVRQAAGGHSVFAAVNVAKVPFPPGFTDDVPPEFQPLLKAETLTLAVDLGKDATVSARLGFANGEAADDALKAAKKAAAFARTALAQPRKQAEDTLYKKRDDGKPRPVEELPEAVAAVAALGGLATLDEILADPPLKRDGNALAATVALPPWVTQYVGLTAVSAGMMLPAVQKVREAATRTQSSNNLKQIGLAMHGYHDTYGHLPPAALVDKKGKKLLSWRVQILPFIEADNLYKQFKLDEPWDSEHNKKLIPLMPKIYADPRLPAAPGQTYYKGFVGKDAGFDPIRGLKFADFTDGLSNTLMVVAAGDPVVWTKPDDIEFDADKPLPALWKPFGNVMAAFFDGSVRYLDGSWVKDNEKMMKLLIQRNDGQPVMLP